MDTTNKPRAGVLALQGAYQAHARALELLGCEVVEVKRPEQLAGLRLLCMPGGESTTMSLLLSSSGLREPLRRAIAGGLPVLATCAGAILLAQRLDGDSGSLKVEPLGLLDLTVDRNAWGRQNESFEAELEVDWEGLGSPKSKVQSPNSKVQSPKSEVQGLESKDQGPESAVRSTKPVDQAQTDTGTGSGQTLHHGHCTLDSFHAVFIRAPRFSSPGPGVRVLASYQPKGSAGPEPVLVRQGRIIAAAFHPELSGDLRIHAAALALADE